LTKYNCLLYGAGAIGALKPNNIDGPKTKNILTHAHAIVKNKQLNLVGIVEPNAGKAWNAGEKWDTHLYYDTADYGENAIDKADIVIIATPTETHHKVLLEVINKLNPKLIICEKPCCESLKQIREIQQNRYTHVVVNYTRRFCPEIMRLKTILECTEIYSAKIVYVRGFIRDASHGIDICNSFFGEFLDGCILNSNSITDYGDEDRTVAAYLSYEKCKHVFFMPTDGRAYDIFNMEICTKSGIYVLEDHFNTIKLFPPKKEKTYGNYNSISGKPAWMIKVDLKDSLVNLYKNCIDFLDGNINYPGLECTIGDADKVHQVYHRLFNRRFFKA
jgi:predicted dehydrogenase